MIDFFLIDFLQLPNYVNCLVGTEIRLFCCCWSNQKPMKKIRSFSENVSKATSKWSLETKKNNQLKCIYNIKGIKWMHSNAFFFCVNNRTKRNYHRHYHQSKKKKKQLKFDIHNEIALFTFSSYMYMYILKKTMAIFRY